VHRLHASEGAPTPAVFRRRSRRDLAISSAANVRRTARCPWPPRRAANHRTAGSEARPGQAFRLTTLMGFTPFAVLILICRPGECFHPPPPTCRSPNVHPGSAIFSNTGRPAVSPASGRSLAQPPAYRSCGTTDHGRSARLLGFSPAVKPCRRNPSVSVAAVLPWALPLAGLRIPAGMRAESRSSQHAVSPGRRSRAHDASGGLIPLPVPYAPELWRPIVSLKCAAHSNVADVHLRCRRLFSVFRC